MLQLRNTTIILKKTHLSSLYVKKMKFTAMVTCSASSDPIAGLWGLKGKKGKKR